MRVARPQKTHCIHGHAMTPDNSIFQWRKSGARWERRCRTCHAAQTLRWARDNRARCVAMSRDWFARNRDKMIAYRREWARDTRRMLYLARALAPFGREAVEPAIFATGSSD